MSILVMKSNPAMEFAFTYLASHGFEVTTTPSPDVTQLLLPVPSFANGTDYLVPILAKLSADVTIFGGNLANDILKAHHTVDLLQDEAYLAANGEITAKCAAALPKLNYSGVPVLILGWGRIGKRLGQLLSKQGANVTVSARNPMDLAHIQGLGMRAIPLRQVRDTASDHRIIFNTIPAMVLPDLHCPSECSVYELASIPGVSGSNIISARGLPGKYAPEDSGTLIAQTFIRLSQSKEH